MSSNHNNNNNNNNNNSNRSRSVPIHYTTVGRFHPSNLNQEPHESEPLQSYEEDGVLASMEEDFHQRLTKHRSSTGGHNGSANPSSFWRTSSNAATATDGAADPPAEPATAATTQSPSEPHFHSAAFNTASTSTTPVLRSSTAHEPSALSAALQAHQQERNHSDGSSSTNTNPNNYRRWDSNPSQDGSIHDSTTAANNNNTRKDARKQRDIAIKNERRYKQQQTNTLMELTHNDAATTSLERGLSMGSTTDDPMDGTTPTGNTNNNTHKVDFTFSDMMAHQPRPSAGGMDRSSSDQSAGSILYSKTPLVSHASMGKSSSLIFPTGMDSATSSGANGDGSSSTTGSMASMSSQSSILPLRSQPGSNNSKQSLPDKALQSKINIILDQCENVRWPLKKKLILQNLGMSQDHIPITYLDGSPLGNSLHKLSLRGNHLGSLPERLVQCLPTLKHLDLSQCHLHTVPTHWSLPQLKSLNLSNNLLRDFLEESILEGLPELHDLNMFGNKVAVLSVPHNTALLSKLETLDLGYNDIAYLPDELDQLRSLRFLKVRNNFLTKIPMRICDMELKSIDVSSNPVAVPPLETCERGICSMKRYYQQMRAEDSSTKAGVEELSRRVMGGKQRSGKNHHTATKKKSGGYSGFMKSLSLSKASPSMLSRKTSPSGGPSSSGNTNNSNHAGTTVSAASPPPLPPTTPRGFGDSDAPATLSSTKNHALSTQSSAASPTTSNLVKPALNKETSDSTTIGDTTAASENAVPLPPQEVTVNDTLKVIFVGMAMVGKTSMIKRLIEGKHAIVPTHDERTVGVDIYAWDPKKDQRFEHIDSRIEFQDSQMAKTCGDVDVKFSVWDFAGQHVYHATHELFFSSNALYVLVWDMGANNMATHRRSRRASIALDQGSSGEFKLSFDDSDDEDEEREETEEEARRAERALERDIDEKIQFWVDCIQTSAPGAAIIPVASFSDFFESTDEAKRRCNVLKERLLRHEQRRIDGIERRLEEYTTQNRADDPAAHRLRDLLHPSRRPKLIFGEDGEESVVRVSGTQYYGFDLLTEKIVNIATGRYKGRWTYPIFYGHVGTRIPRMRLQVRDAVRTMRDKFKVVEWGYFLNQLRDMGLTSVEDISDALHFLTSIGELSYFGSVMPTNNNQLQENPEVAAMSPRSQKKTPNRQSSDTSQTSATDSKMDDEDEDDIDNAVLSIDETSITATTEDGSLSTIEDFMASGLSQFVFLNPRWLVAAVACILRHDLDREIKETRRLLESGHVSTPASSFQEASLNCPVITAEDALMLWQAKKITKKAAERAQAYSNNMTVTPFEFLQLLLIRFGVFVPIDLSIEKALLGGKEYAKLVDNIQGSAGTPSTSTESPLSEVTVEQSSEDLALKATFFFLPSLLGPGEPTEVWTYKNTESWKTTLCHSVLFPDGVPPGLMERLTASVLSSVYAASNRHDPSVHGGTASSNVHGHSTATCEGRLVVREVLCWRTAFFLKLGTVVPSTDGSHKESVVEIFCHLAERDSPMCVGSQFMAVGTRRLIVSGRGQVGDGGRKIWKGGYLLVCKCVTRVMENYGGLEYETVGFCPECLAKKPVSEASYWEFTAIRSAVKNGEGTLRCQHHGHVVDTRFVAGPVDSLQRTQDLSASAVSPATDPGIPVQEMLPAVVLVGLWDGKLRKVIRAGSGVIVDRKRGLIVTAGHTLMNVWGHSQYPFGENYYGLPHGRVVIGVISNDNKGMAVFRYFAKIVAKDTSLERGECHLDVCVLRITTKMENDVSGNGEGCGDQPEILLLNNEAAFKSEKLQALRVSEKCELDEQVRILGFNQGGEGLLGPGESLNRFVDFARGYVCKKFVSAGDSSAPPQTNNRDLFKPREEIAVICPTIGGHSGGPCVNQQGEVIGILSRADPADGQRCYLSPTSEWKPLIKLAKKSDGGMMNDLMMGNTNNLAL